MTNHVISAFFEELALAIKAKEFCLSLVLLLGQPLLLVKDRIKVAKGRALGVAFSSATNTLRAARGAFLR
jgi:hypothetical protein